MINIFIFPNAVRKTHQNDKYKLNIIDNILTYIYNDQHVIVDTNLIPNGSSTMIMHNPNNNDLYVLYNFREILQLTNLKPKDFFIEYQRQGLVQIDKSRKGLFIKVFLLKGDFELESDTTDFSVCPHLSLSEMYELDRKYSWKFDKVCVNILHSKVTISLNLIVSDFWTEKLYINHAGQSKILHPGYNEVIFDYVNTEDAYVGTMNSHYSGRKISLS